MTQRRKGGVPDEDLALFRDAVRDATPLKRTPRASPRTPAPPPLPVLSLLDAHGALAESVAGPIVDREDAEFVGKGIGRDVLRKLRRGQWVVQDSLDLHGYNRAQARAALTEFIVRSARRGERCVHIVHGKGRGSPHGEPVLRSMVRGALALRDEVLAYCEAPANQGGSGALLVLLRAS